MKTDISRRTFAAASHYSGVRAQQGRVQVDADLNEHADIVNHHTRTTASDLIGRCGVPYREDDNGDPVGGFEVGYDTGTSKFTLSKGRYYVNGILVENEAALTTLESNYAATSPDVGQPEVGGLSTVGPGATGDHYAVYLDVWEREVAAVDATYLADPALGEVDPTTRTRVSWQVRFWAFTGSTYTCEAALAEIRGAIDPTADGELTVGTDATSTTSDPCLGPSSSGYRGTENQLYRVEIHTAGEDGTATWKWSRENAWVVASVTAPVTSDTGSYWFVTVDRLGPDDDRGLVEGATVELYSDETLLNVNQATAPTTWSGTGWLGYVDSVDGTTLRVLIPGATSLNTALVNNIRLRRWDGAGTWNTTTGTLAPLTTSSSAATLESGITVAFDGTFRTGQYWTFAARTAAGAVLSPPTDAPAEGPIHHYCVLAVAERVGASWTLTDCRERFLAATDQPVFEMVSGDGQCGVPGNRLQWPLKVRVGTVAGETVTFTTVNTLAGLSENAFATTWTASENVDTDAEGIATCYWWLTEDVSSTGRTQQVLVKWKDQTLVFGATFRDPYAMWVTEFKHGTLPLIPEAWKEATNTDRPDDGPLSGASEIDAGVVSTNSTFTLTIHNDLEGPHEGTDKFDDVEHLFWDASSIAVYFEPTPTPPAAQPVLHLPTLVSFALSNPASYPVYGREVHLVVVIQAVPTTPSVGRLVFHLRPKTRAKHNTSLAIVPAPYGVLTCKATFNS